MKIIAVRNAQIHPQFQPTVHLGFDPATSDLSVSLYLPELATDEATSGDTGLSLIESVVVNIADLRKRYDWCDHQTYFVAVHAGAFLPVFALYPETLPNRETAVDYAQRLKRNLLVGINVPFATASDDELFVTVNLNAQATDTNIQVDEHCALVWSEAASSGAVRTMAFPFIHLQAPSSVPLGGSASIELRIEDVAGQLLDKEAVVYLEAVSGLVPFARVRATHGLATVPVSAAGMSAGDEILAPAATPNDKVDYMNRAVAKVINDSVMKTRFTQMGISPKPLSRSQFESVLKDDWLQASPLIAQFKIVQD